MYVRRTNKAIAKRSFRRDTPSFTRVPRLLKTPADTLSLLCESYTPLRMLDGGSHILFKNQTYQNSSLSLSDSLSFLEQQSQYARYKITAISLKFDNAWDHQDADRYYRQYPPIAVAFYPHKFNFNAELIPLASDTKAYFSTSPGNTNPNTHTWTFKDGFFEAATGGYGTWNNMSTFLQLVGQLSVAIPTTYDATSPIEVGMMRITHHVQFSSKIS